jgi:hypothetical protein
VRFAEALAETLSKPYLSGLPVSNLYKTLSERELNKIRLILERKLEIQQTRDKKYSL